MNEPLETPNSETPPTETPPANGETPQTTTPPAEEPKSLAGAAGEPPKEETPPAFEPLTAEALQFPEGAVVDEGLRDEFLGIVNDQELDPAGRANALLGLWTKGLEAAQTKGLEDFNALQEAAQNEVRADPSLGGAKLEGTLVSIGKLVEEFGSPELRQVLDVTGAGNSIHMIRFLHTLAGKLTEGSIQPPGIPPAAAEQNAASKMFPSMKG